MNDITTYQEQINQINKRQMEQTRMSLLDFEYFTNKHRLIDAEIKKTNGQVEFLGYCMAVLLGILCGTSIALSLIRFNIL